MDGCINLKASENGIDRRYGVGTVLLHIVIVVLQETARLLMSSLSIFFFNQIFLKSDTKK